MERHADIEMTVVEEEDFTHSSLELEAWLSILGCHSGKHLGQSGGEDAFTLFFFREGTNK